MPVSETTPAVRPIAAGNNEMLRHRKVEPADMVSEGFCRQLV